MKLKILYSIKKDTENYLNGVYEFKYLKHGRKNIRDILLAKINTVLREKIKNSRSREEASNYIADFLAVWEKDNSNIIKTAINNLKSGWEENEKEILKKIEALYRRPFPFYEVTIYLTSLSLCPYSYEKRFIYIYIKEPAEKQIRVLLHELNHFMFYFYYPQLKGELGYEKYELLKESLTFFSNPEQKGKPDEKKLRELYASKNWKNIDEIIKNGGRLLKGV